ncbi:hypothetical protein LTR85_005735 [Meristemomyces frigidus]|nr:hypothetical protein LTR85_005735 [Meristemomyces frigidus]
MGRRPNQLVLEFFQRGPKLPDASNRYEHSCKRCGEVFPKGRLDSLMGHILRRCPNVTQHDRETVFLHVQSTPARPTPNSKNNRQGDNAINSLPLHIPHHQQPHDQEPQHQDPQHHRPHHGQPMDMQLQHEVAPQLYLQQQQQQQQQQQSALGMLAEVSRRHLDYSSHRQYAGEQEQAMNDEGRALAKQALLMQFQQVSGGTHHPFTRSAEDAGQYMYPTNGLQMAPKFDFTAGPVHEAAPSATVASPPEMEQRLKQAQLQNHTVDPQLGDDFPPAVATPEPTGGQASTQFMIWNPTNPSGKQTFGTLSAPPNEPPLPYALLHQHTKKTARGRFSDTRRKEVQEIRKRGACIRCRMLKKPCSEGTPCNTCANVESARLWKGTCIRTRLAEEFTLWSTGLFHSKARVEVPAAVQSLHQLALPGRVEARFFGNGDLCMSFAVKQYSVSAEAKQRLDPSLQQDGGEATCVWLLDEGENMSDKVEEYVNRAAQSRIINEESPFLRATLQQALDLLDEEQIAQTNLASEPHASRSCYNLQSQLLKNIVELWVETCVITSPNQLDLSLHYNANKVPQHQPDNFSASVGSGSPAATCITPSSHSYDLIKSQLLAATESRCSKLAKSVINELERRLLQRQQVSRFATFISAVILLSCVERITGFYRAFDVNGEFASAFDFATWPLEDPPHRLWTQGEHFAELLIMLLRMRALPPKTQQKPDGTLGAVQDYTLPVHVHGRPVKEQIDEQIKAAAAWLDPIKLTVHELATKGASVPRSGDGLNAWDMKFLAKALLPETVTK